MTAPLAAPTKRPKRLRGVAALCWLVILGSVAVGIIAGTGPMRERDLIDNSLYVVVAFGFAVGMLVGVRSVRKQDAIAAKDYLGILVAGAIGMCIAAVARWYFFENVFDKL